MTHSADQNTDGETRRAIPAKRYRYKRRLEIKLDARVKEVYQDIYDQIAGEPSRPVKRVLWDDVRPLGMFGRRLADMREDGRSFAEVERIIETIRDVMKEEYGAA